MSTGIPCFDLHLFFAACSYAYGISRHRRKDAIAIIGLLLVSVSAIMITYHTLRVKPAEMLERGRELRQSKYKRI